MATNLFKTASVIAAKPVAGKKPIVRAILIEYLEVYAAIDHTTKWLKGIAEVVKTSVVDAAKAKFIADGIAKKAKPDSFDGKEGDATAKLIIGKRSSASGLNDVEKELAAKYNVPVEVVADRPETFIINPEHLDWINKNGAKVSAALMKLGAPQDIIKFQETTTKTVTTEDSIDYVFRTYHEKPEIIEALLPVVASISVKPKFNAEESEDENKDAALEVLKAYLGED